MEGSVRQRLIILALTLDKIEQPKIRAPHYATSRAGKTSVNGGQLLMVIRNDLDFVKTSSGSVSPSLRISDLLNCEKSDLRPAKSEKGQRTLSLPQNSCNLCMIRLRSNKSSDISLLKSDI
jgi:hypothetical protein